jgi:hypothetical protein
VSGGDQAVKVALLAVARRHSSGAGSSGRRRARLKKYVSILWDILIAVECTISAVSALEIALAESSAHDSIDTSLKIQYPFSRCCVLSIKKKELRMGPPPEDRINSRFWICESTTKTAFQPHHNAVEKLRAAGGRGHPAPRYIIGSLCVAGFQRLEECDLTEEVAEECALTLEGLRQAWQKVKQKYATKIYQKMWPCKYINMQQKYIKKCGRANI